MASYYLSEDLARFGEVGGPQPKLFKMWLVWYNECHQDGALDKKTKALIALSVAHVLQCPYCIDAWTTGSQKKARRPSKWRRRFTSALHCVPALRCASHPVVECASEGMTNWIVGVAVFWIAGVLDFWINGGKASIFLICILTEKKTMLMTPARKRAVVIGAGRWVLKLRCVPWMAVSR
jgi:AhpD family alkylhydroperoxidase